MLGAEIPDASASRMPNRRSHSEIAIMLVRLHWLGEAKLNDRIAIGAAIARLLAGVE